MSGMLKKMQLMQSSILVGTGTFHLTRSHLIFIVLYMLKRYTELLVRKYEGITEKKSIVAQIFSVCQLLEKRWKYIILQEDMG